MNKTPAPSEAPISPVSVSGSHALVPVEDHLRESIQRRLLPYSRLFKVLSFDVRDGQVRFAGQLENFHHQAMLISTTRKITDPRGMGIDISGITVPENKPAFKI